MTYTVSSGDSLSAIAKRFTGDWTRWVELLPGNPQIKNPDASKPFDTSKNVIFQGMTLVVPDSWTRGPTATPTSDYVGPLKPENRAMGFLALGVVLILGYYALS